MSEIALLSLLPLGSPLQAPLSLVSGRLCEFRRPLQAGRELLNRQKAKGSQGAEAREQMLRRSDSLHHGAEPAHRSGGLEGVFGESTTSPQRQGALLRLCRPSNGLFQNRILMS